MNITLRITAIKFSCEEIYKTLFFRRWPVISDWVVWGTRLKKVLRGMIRESGLDGLRGLASLAVVLSHCILAFWPAMHGFSVSEETPTWELIIFNSPFTGVFNGTYSVFIFFVLSGYVLSIGFFKSGREGVIQSLFLRRYLRLAIPVTASCLLTAFLWKLGAFKFTSDSLHDWVLFAYQSDMTIIGGLEHGLIKSIFLNSGEYNYVLWTMTIEYFGSLLVFFNCLLLKNNKNKLFIYFLEVMLLYIVLKQTSYYYMCFIVGMMIAEFRSKNEHFNIKLVPAMILGMVALYLGGFHNGSKSYFLFLGSNVSVIYLIAATITVVCVAYNRNISSALSRQVPAFLGRISFPLYLIHSLVLRSIGVWLFGVIFGAGYAYSISAIVASIVVVIISILLAIPFEQIDKVGIWLSKKAENIFSTSGKNINTSAVQS